MTQKSMERAVETRGIVNIINFIRGVEPRIETDLITPIKKQMELAQKHKLPATWLLQYDALIDKSFTDLLKSAPERDEIGAWFEFVQPMAEKAGVKWRGRYPWDWHVNVGFSVGYTQKERFRMVDVYMADFKKTFGYYPKSAGSWFIDAATLGYLSDKYGIVASCNCRDQWGVDGYTLWGGYLNQAYYPSRLNSYVPAQSKARQIPVPVFRMLGNDPINFHETKYMEKGQEILTLEPIYPEKGGNPRWIDWFLKTIFESPCLSFGYAQVGQENSFGWPKMEQGLIHQHKRLEEMQRDGLIRVETLAQSGEWFKAKYETTPASAIVGMHDLEQEGKGALWFCSKRYRASLIWDESSLRLRDLHIFDELYKEPFLDAVCESSACTYDTLPVMDAFRWSSKESRAGFRIVDVCGKPLKFENLKPSIQELSGQQELKADFGEFSFLFKQESFELRGPAGQGWSLSASWSKEAAVSFIGVENGKAQFRHKGAIFQLEALAGSIAPAEGGFKIQPDASGLASIGFASHA